MKISTNTYTVTCPGNGGTEVPNWVAIRPTFRSSAASSDSKTFNSSSFFHCLFAISFNSGMSLKVFKMAGITRNVIIRNARTGENELVPIDTVASSHLARRTFIGNAYFKVSDPNLIGKMSGHVDGSRAFKRYRNIEDETLKSVINLIG